MFRLNYFLLLFVLILPLGAQNPGRLEDDSPLRLSLLDSWFNASPGRVLGNPSFIHTLKGGSRIQVRAEAGAAAEEFMIVLAREWKGSPELYQALRRALGVGGEAWLGSSRGSWNLYRRKDTGEPLRIRVFLGPDPYTYVQFRPFESDKSLMDLVIYEGYVIQSAPIPLPFKRLMVLPVEDVLAMAGDSFPRRYFEPDAALYRDKRNFVAQVRRRLPELSYRDDGAIDENGRYVFIETLAGQDSAAGPAGLNCSGFAKWIVDGLLRPLTGARLPIPPLKEAFGDRGNSFTAAYEESRDPYFGLDWIRNLASRVAAFSSPALGSLEEIEVRRWPFSQIIQRGGNGSVFRSYAGFLPDAGFSFEGLRSLLYALAIDEPGRIYLAAVSAEIGAPSTADNLRGKPRMRQYFHVAVLVPYFNDQGIFQTVVFESAEETSFTRFRTRYPSDHYVNLVRIPVEGEFDP